MGSRTSRPSAPALGEFDSLGADVAVSTAAFDRFAHAHDASHYFLLPDAVVTPRTADDVARVMKAASDAGRPITFRSGGTSLSGQASTDGILVDTRAHFRRIEILDGGARVRVEPGATVRQVNARLAKFGRKLGPDPASEIACTIGGVVANNSSGMACGIVQNCYRTIESLVMVLPGGVVIDTADEDADDRLLATAPALHSGLARLRADVLASPSQVTKIREQFAMKNTMGYGINSLLDFERPVDILAHLLIGSEGTLAFVASVTFRTVEVLPHIATGLLVFPSLHAATAALPALVDSGMATIELMDSLSLEVTQRSDDAPEDIAGLQIDGHAALLVELQASSGSELAAAERRVAPLLDSLPLVVAPALTTEPEARAALWHVRKGLYTAVAGARPSGTTALLEDIVVPVPRLLDTCERLLGLFERHGYHDAVIFGHAKDGNVHFMLTERFDDEQSLDRYRAFTEEMVDLILENGGSLKAEHGTGRIMAPFVRRQYGDDLYAVMNEIKRLCDPEGILNPGVLLSDDPQSYLRDMKTVPTVEPEVDRCVECGYCEPTCPSRDLTLTPRQRIALRRDIALADARGRVELATELRSRYDYAGEQTCAVDGMCAVACPVNINTGDLVRRLRGESSNPVLGAIWGAAAKAWGPTTRVGALALSTAKVLPTAAVAAVTVAGRALAGEDTVPLYSRELPGGGRARPPATAPGMDADAVFFASCIGTMFGAERSHDSQGAIGSTEAFLRLAERARLSIAVPDGLAGMCCGTPWKSKGFGDGYAMMSRLVLPALLTASDGGRIPIVCDAASCTEGLETMRELAASSEQYSALRFVDSTEYARTAILPALSVSAPVDSIAVHPTCSTTALGATDSLVELARFISPDVTVPLDWGCCAFAGDRGLLHPELTASATGPEAEELAGRDFAAYASANRTCELGMTRATGKPYRHILELVEEATR